MRTLLRLQLFFALSALLLVACAQPTPTPTPTPTPVASFSLDVASGSAPLTVRFGDTSQGTITSWRWDFGDGASSTEGNPTYEYTRAGSYSVQLKVSGPGGSDTATLVEPVKVTPGPLDHVTFEPASPRVEVTKEQRFIARAFDRFDNPIPGLNFTFRSAEQAGQVDSQGRFTAGTKTGTYEDAMTVEATQGTVTRRDTATVTIEPGPLDRVRLEPATATIEVAQEIQFTATAFDQFDNAIPGLTYTFQSKPEAGHVDSQGRFTAGTRAGRYESAIAVDVTLGPITRTATADITITFKVNSTIDTVDANPGDGVCDDGAGNCTLRAAIMEANALVGSDTITLPAGTYTLSIAGTDEDAAATGDLDITDDLTITGAGQAITIIDGSALDRVFHVFLSNTVDISDLTVQKGNTIRDDIVSGNGGGIYTAGTLTLTSSTVSGNIISSAISFGGGIYNSGALTLTDSTISGNMTSRFGGGDGGGIYNSGTLSLTDSNISGNDGRFGGGVINLGGNVTAINSTVSANHSRNSGGGIYNGGQMTLTNTTVSDNRATQNGGGIDNSGQLTLSNSTVSGNFSSGGIGAGIYNGGQMTLINSTVSGNTVALCRICAGGGFYNHQATLTMRNSIIAGNIAPADPDCHGAPISLGYNLIGNDSGCGFTAATGDLVGTSGNPVDPFLGSLQDHGGPTLTQALLPGSPGIDAVPVVDCVDPDGNPLTTDQRGIARPQGAACDIGAFESDL